MEKGKLRWIIIILAVFTLIVLPEILDNIKYDQYEEDCTSQESFQEKSWVTEVGECVPSAEAEFCEKVLRCTEDIYSKKLS